MDNTNDGKAELGRFIKMPEKGGVRASETWHKIHCFHLSPFPNAGDTRAVMLVREAQTE